MESQPQFSAEFRINPGNFYPCKYEICKKTRVEAFLS